MNRKKKERNVNFWNVKIGILFCIMFALFMSLQLEILAGQNQELKQGTLVTLLQDADMYEKPDGTSKVLFSFKAGDAVFQTGEAENGWYPVMYHMVNGYINASGNINTNVSITTNGGSVEVESDENENTILEIYTDEKAVEEMDILDDQMNNFGTEVELDRKHAKQTRIWGAVIVLLLLAFVGSSILPTIKEQKKLKAQNDEADKDVT